MSQVDNVRRSMNVPPTETTKRANRARTVARGAVQLAIFEYLPMAAMIGFWAIVALSIGHANTARLLAATVMLRGVMMFAELSTTGPLRARAKADPDVRRRSIRNAALMQGGSLLVCVLLLIAVTAGLRYAEHALMAQLLWAVAIGLPARSLRMVLPGAFPRRMRLYMTGSAIACAGTAWALGGGAVAMAIAYAGREWLSLVVGAFVGDNSPPRRRLINERLRFAEVAKNTVVSGRRLLTYRLTKNILTVFGPFGNFAARTGRGLKMHSKLERYMPHKRMGFVFFALVTGGLAVFAVTRSKEPAALIAGAGLAQLCAIALNVLLLWRYLPLRDDPDLIVEEDDDD